MFPRCGCKIAISYPKHKIILMTITCSPLHPTFFTSFVIASEAKQPRTTTELVASGLLPRLHEGRFTPRNDDTIHLIISDLEVIDLQRKS